MNTIKCVRCKVEKSTSEFYKRPDRKSGYEGTCKSCNVAQSIIRQKVNKDRVNECARLRYKNNPDKYRKLSRDWDRNHPERRKEISKKCRSRELYKIKEREYGKVWSKNNPEKVKARRNRWESKPENKETKRKLLKRWRDEHPNKSREHNQNRRARLHGSGGIITDNEWDELLRLYNYSCLCCGKQEVKLTIDHIIPISLGGKNVIDNIQPLCKTCNSKKHTKIIDYRKGKINV